MGRRYCLERVRALISLESRHDRIITALSPSYRVRRLMALLVRTPRIQRARQKELIQRKPLSHLGLKLQLQEVLSRLALSRLKPQSEQDAEPIVLEESQDRIRSMRTLRELEVVAHLRGKLTVGKTFK